MLLQQTRTFQKIIKKLYPNQKYYLDGAIKEIIQNPLIGEAKKGDLDRVRVYKFNMLNQLTFLAYLHSEAMNSITLLALGFHENFYTKLKRK